MRVLLCKTEMIGPVSGADETLVTYACQLRRSGHDVSVALLYRPAHADEYLARLRSAGVETFTLVTRPVVWAALKLVRRAAQRVTGVSSFGVWARSWARSVWHGRMARAAARHASRCRRHFESTGCDVVHVLSPDAGTDVLIRAGVAAGIPVIYQELGMPALPANHQAAYDRFTRAVPLCDELAALSPRLAKDLAARHPSGPPVSVLPLIVEDVRRASTAARRSDIVFGFAARLDALKGTQDLLQAFADLHDSIEHVQLKMAGEGPDSARLSANAKRLDLDDACEFVGAYRGTLDRGGFMRLLDAFVLPTYVDGTPNAIIEAMSHGLPIIASRVGGIPDMVTPDCGILIVPGDTRALTAAMGRLASDHAVRRRMGDAARIRYETLFSPGAVMPTLLQTYQRVARQPRDTAAARAAHPWTGHFPAAE